jgi:hypothetical protein
MDPVIGVSGVGIRYADETARDRDEHGVLWVRAPSLRGIGLPRFGAVHPLRQRRAMRELLCQICARPADRSGQGMLWLLPDHRGDWRGWPDDMGNSYPPLCLPCARLSVRTCPHLRRGWVAVRAHSRVAGVLGAVHQPGVGAREAIEPAVVAYSHRRIRWTLAGQLVRTLHHSTIVDL